MWGLSKIQQIVDPEQLLSQREWLRLFFYGPRRASLPCFPSGISLPWLKLPLNKLQLEFVLTTRVFNLGKWIIKTDPKKHLKHTSLITLVNAVGSFYSLTLPFCLSPVYPGDHELVKRIPESRTISINSHLISVFILITIVQDTLTFHFTVTFFFFFLQ